ncbi:MAG: hypothetical protein H7A53_09905 [Akkermansiaceae bacterium]|nr:hypothetical protein [Akkermansiaceae bacterium]
MFLAFGPSTASVTILTQWSTKLMQARQVNEVAPFSGFQHLGMEGRWLAG